MPVKFDDNNAQYIEEVVGRIAAVTVRSNVTDDDANEAAVYALDSGVDCTGYDVIEVEIDMTGSQAGDSFIITPLAKIEDQEAYARLLDKQIAFEADDAITRKIRVSVGGNSNVNFLCNGSLGTSPTIASIKVVPLTGV